MLKLFIWKEVLCDYTCGIIMAIAHDLEEARAVVIANQDEWICDWLTREIDRITPEVHDIAPISFYVTGGG